MIKKLIIGTLLAFGFLTLGITNAQAATFTAINRDLDLGATGTDVAMLQSFLVAEGYLTIPPGNIPGRYGNLTQAAVIKYQRVKALPGSGFFGPRTRSAYTTDIAVTTPIIPTTPTLPAVPATPTAVTTPITPTTTTFPPGCTSTVGYSVTNGKKCDSSPTTVTPPTSGGTVTLGGDATFEDYSADEGETTELSEGESGAEVFEAEFSVVEGDAELKRVDFNFEYTGNDEGEDQPWETFDKATLMIGSKKVASIDAGDEDSWTEEEEDEMFRIRFSEFSYVAKEDADVKIILVLDVNDDLDNADEGDTLWEISIPDEGIRGVTAGNHQEEIGDSGERVEVAIGGEGSSDDISLEVSESDDNPSADDVEVSLDGRSEWINVLSFDLAAEGEDIDVAEIPVTLEFLDDGTFDDYVDDLKLEIDGDDFDDFDVNDDEEGEAIIKFNLEDVSVGDGDSTMVTLWVRFNKQDSNYEDGDRVRAEISGSNVDEIEAEGSDDLTSEQLSGSARGGTQTLVVD